MTIIIDEHLSLLGTIERKTLARMISLRNEQLCNEALARLARAMKTYAAELVTIGDLTVRKP